MARRALLSDDVLTVPRIEPWLGREMAGELQTERFFAGLPAGFREQKHPSEILRHRSEPGQRVGELYRDMLRKDSDLAAFELKQREAVIKLPRFIVPSSSTPRAIEVAKFCRQALGIVSDLQSTLEHQLLSRAMGIALDELRWERIVRGPLTRAVLPVAICDRPMHRFAFSDEKLHVRQLGTSPLLPVLAPPGKFLVMRHGTKDSPWGEALLDYVYWYWFMKKHAWKFRALFVEKWAQPSVKVTYPHRQGADDQAKTFNEDSQRRALALAEAIQTEFSFAVPQGILVELLQAALSGNDPYESFVAACTRGESLVFLGEINTSGLRQGTGSYASEEVSNEIRYEKVQLAANALGAHLKDTLLRWIVEINFGPDEPPPLFKVEHLDAGSRELRIKGIERALNDEEPIPRTYYYMTLQIPEPEEGEDTIVGKPKAPPPPQLQTQVGDGNQAPPPPGPRATPPAPAGEPPPRQQQANNADLADDEVADIVAEAQRRDDALAAIAADYRQFTLDHYEHHQQLVLEAWDAGHFGDGTGLRWLVDRMDARAHARRIETAQIHGMGAALEHLVAEGLEPRFWRVPAPAPVSRPTAAAFAAARDSRLAGDTPATAIDYWARRLGITKDLFNTLSDENRRFAFTVAGVTDARLLLEIQHLTARAGAEGWTRTRFRDELRTVYERAGVAPTADWHADLVYQNNVRQANGAVRYEQLVNNAAAQRLIPYLMFTTLGDDVVRARPQHNHRVMHERIFATTHEIWRTWWYPAGFGCRCLVASINRPKAQRMGLIGAEPTGPWPVVESGRALPDPGFRGAPSLAAAAAASTAQLTELVQDVRTTDGSPSLLDALRQLLELLGIDLFGDLL